MKKEPFFPHFKVRAWSQKYPPFSLFLGTSMRAPFHSKFSDRGRPLLPAPVVLCLHFVIKVMIHNCSN